jgi:parallel beta-helix repeat protein
MEEHPISRRTLLAAAAGAVSAATMSSGEDPSLGFMNPGSNTKSLQNHSGLLGLFNVKDYGAKGDGRANDSPAITAAIAAVPTSGGIVYFPPGIYALGSSIVITARSDLTFLGAGVSATRLQMSANGVTVLSFTGTCSRIAIRDIWVGAVQSYETGGGLRIVGNESTHSDTFVVENVRLQNLPAPWFSQYLDNSQIRNIRVMQTIPGAIKTVAMLMNSCVSDTFTEVVMLSTAGQFATEGVRVDFDCDTIIFINSQVLHAGTVGWRCSQTSGHTGPRLCRFTNCYAESCTRSGWLIQAARDVRLSGCHAAVNGGHGFEITGGDSITVHNSLALSNKRHGIVITGGSSVLLDGNTCSNNGQEANVTYCGIRIENNVTGVRIVNNRCGDFVFTIPNKQKYGISLGAVGTEFMAITGNDLRGNAGGGLDNASTGTGHMIGQNIGVGQ